MDGRKGLRKEAFFVFPKKPALNFSTSKKHLLNFIMAEITSARAFLLEDKGAIRLECANKTVLSFFLFSQSSSPYFLISLSLYLLISLLPYLPIPLSPYLLISLHCEYYFPFAILRPYLKRTFFLGG